jgi:hypothetical protein
MDSFEQQELRARQALSVGAVMKTGFTVGAIFFVMSGGSPWTTAGTMNMIMGRDFDLGFWSLLIGHFAVAFLYTWIIGSIIYRLKTPSAVAVAVLLGVALYGANALAYFALQGKSHSLGEFVPCFVHITFSLFAGLLYKAFSVPNVASETNFDPTVGN